MTPLSRPIKCKKCRTILCQPEDLLKSHHSNCQSLFLNSELIYTKEIPPILLPYIDTKETVMDSTMYCINEKCKTKLGKYSWTGVQCGCGIYETPAFYLMINKVDL